jgi:molybdate transport system substrate-binding protein
MTRPVTIPVHRLLVAATALVVSFALVAPARAADARRPGLLVFAAASLTDALGEISANWTRTSGVPVKLSFASSAVLARQIEAGGRADAFVPADEEWMDYLDARGLVEKSSRRVIVANRLVLIAPADSTIRLKIEPGFRLGEALGARRLATGDPDTVPVGRYARSALESLGVWDSIAPRLVRADNVRNALNFVARGETPLGIVYATDAKAESAVRVIDAFPSNTHAPILYPAATTRGARPETIAYLNYLSGAEAGVVWEKFGFLEPVK